MNSKTLQGKARAMGVDRACALLARNGTPLPHIEVNRWMTGAVNSKLDTAFRAALADT